VSIYTLRTHPGYGPEVAPIKRNGYILFLGPTSEQKFQSYP